MSRKSAIPALSQLLLGLLLSGCSAPAAEHLTYRIVHAYPHDAEIFTEGLEYRNGVLYESSGLYDKSFLAEENLKTGAVLKKIPVSPSVFGEGITIIGDRLFQVTWQSQLGFVYALPGGTQTSVFHYTGEGWGLTNDGKTIYMSDGTPTIRCVDPATFTVTREITVRDGGQLVENVNELEWVKGTLYANIWHQNRIARINPASGEVTAWIDLTGLRPKEATNEEAVPNGIAYDTATGHLLVTGKYWPKIFEITLVPKR